jgi:hypothetical protein
MVKMVKVICIAGILALLVLFVIFTGDGRSSTQKNVNDKVFKEQATKTNKTKSISHKKSDINTNVESNVFNIPW